MARAFTATFSGIAPADAPGFIAAQFVGAVLAAVLLGWLLRLAAKNTAEPVPDYPQSADAVTELQQN